MDNHHLDVRAAFGNDPMVLWRAFRAAFVEEICQCGADALAASWSSRGGRTSFYTSTLLRGIAGRLDLDLDTERFKIDYAFVRRVEPQPLRVPVVLLESENDVDSATDELEKLCRLAAPLRVLLTVAEWSSVWAHEGRKHAFLRSWMPIIEACGTNYPQTGALAIIIGERVPDHTIRFHTVLFDGSGKLVEESQQLRLEPLSA